jgi:hypothetical protein
MVRQALFNMNIHFIKKTSLLLLGAAGLFSGLLCSCSTTDGTSATSAATGTSADRHFNASSGSWH